MTKLRTSNNLKNNTLRRDAYEKVTGRAAYTTDITLPGMLHAKVLRSPEGHARILNIDSSFAKKIQGVHAVLTREDIKTYSNSELMPVFGYFIKDQPIVAIDKVLYKGDIVAAVAAKSERIANKALAAIKVDYETLPAVSTIDEALDPDAAELFENPLLELYHRMALGLQENYVVKKISAILSIMRLVQLVHLKNVIIFSKMNLSFHGCIIYILNLLLLLRHGLLMTK